MVIDVPGQWAGGFRAWDPTATYRSTMQAASDGRILTVPSTALRDFVARWYPLALHLINAFWQTVRRFDALVLEREGLVALGQLAAGLAHELNNPAAAATRSVDALQDASDQLLASLVQMADGSMSAAQFVGLNALRREIATTSAGLDPVAVAVREEAVTSWLEAHGVASAWRLAPVLAAAGADVAWCARAAEAAPGELLEPSLEWLASSLATTSLMAEVKEATRRISSLVAAVGSYSQLDRAARQEVDVTEGIESTLAMLGHGLRDGISVVREYDPSAQRIEANAAELNQVWTNLIDNALDAMGGGGTLTVSTHADGDGVIVAVADTGGGMSPEVRAHAFDPFFTTKDVGKGTGLGLDISRRIVVERHNGSIDIESAPGRTVVRVRLPRQPASRPEPA